MKSGILIIVALAIMIFAPINLVYAPPSVNPDWQG